MTNDNFVTLDVIESAMAQVSMREDSQILRLKKAADAEHSLEGLNEEALLPLGNPACGDCALSARRIRPRSIAVHLLSAGAGAVAMWFVLVDSNDMAAASPVPEIASPVPVAVSVAGVPVAPTIALEKHAEVAPERALVLDMLEHWRLAWSSRAVDSYLGFYSEQFVPADGASRSVWAEGRRKNLLSKAKIDVQIDNVKIASADERQAKVQLLQSYESGGYKEIGRAKTLLLTREGNEWRIVGEWQGLR